MVTKQSMGVFLSLVLDLLVWFYSVLVIACNSYLRSSGGVRICPSQSASNVKNRPRHITTKWERHGPSRSVTQQKMHITQQWYARWPSGPQFTQVCMKVKDKCFFFTCLKVVVNGVLLYSRYFAGAEQHSELVHIQRYFASFLRSQPLSKIQKIQYHIFIYIKKTYNNFYSTWKGL